LVAGIFIVQKENIHQSLIRIRRTKRITGLKPHLE